jgi:hypothetical protein
VSCRILRLTSSVKFPMISFSITSETWSLILRVEHRLRVFEDEGDEEDIWAYEGRGNRGVELTT